MVILLVVGFAFAGFISGAFVMALMVVASRSDRNAEREGLERCRKDGGGEQSWRDYGKAHE